MRDDPERYVMVLGEALGVELGDELGVDDGEEDGELLGPPPAVSAR